MGVEDVAHHRRKDYLLASKNSFQKVPQITMSGSVSTGVVHRPYLCASRGFPGGLGISTNIELISSKIRPQAIGAVYTSYSPMEAENTPESRTSCKRAVDET